MLDNPYALITAAFIGLAFLAVLLLLENARISRLERRVSDLRRRSRRNGRRVANGHEDHAPEDPATNWDFPERRRVR